MGLPRMTDDVGRLKDLLLLLISIVLYTVERESNEEMCVRVYSFQRSSSLFPSCHNMITTTNGIIYTIPQLLLFVD